MTSAFLIVCAFFVGWAEPHHSRKRWVIMAVIALVAALSTGTAREFAVIGIRALADVPLLFIVLLAHMAVPFSLAVWFRNHRRGEIVRSGDRT
jgi:hypothetical protein